jgi:hypothetical protein
VYEVPPTPVFTPGRYIRLRPGSVDHGHVTIYYFAFVNEAMESFVAGLHAAKESLGLINGNLRGMSW